MKRTKIEKVTVTCTFVSLAVFAINVFNLDRAGEVKPNLRAINHAQRSCRRRK